MGEARTNLIQINEQAIDLVEGASNLVCHVDVQSMLASIFYEDRDQEKWTRFVRCSIDLIDTSARLFSITQKSVDKYFDLSKARKYRLKDIYDGAQQKYDQRLLKTINDLIYCIDSVPHRTMNANRVWYIAIFDQLPAVHTILHEALPRSIFYEEDRAFIKADTRQYGLLIQQRCAKLLAGTLKNHKAYRALVGEFNHALTTCGPAINIEENE